MSEFSHGINVPITGTEKTFSLIVGCYARNSLGAVQGPTTICFSTSYQGHGLYGEVRVKVKTFDSRGSFLSISGEIVGNNTFATFLCSYNLATSKGMITLYEGTHIQLEFDFCEVKNQPSASS